MLFTTTELRRSSSIINLAQWLGLIYDKELGLDFSTS